MQRMRKKIARKLCVGRSEKEKTNHGLTAYNMISFVLESKYVHCISASICKIHCSERTIESEKREFV